MNTVVVRPQFDPGRLMHSLSMHGPGDEASEVLRHGVFIVEDHAGMRRALRRLVERLPHFYVMGEAASAEEALASLDGQVPGVVLVDLNLPGMNGIDLIKALTERARIKCVVVSAYAESERVQAALSAGARAFVSKDQPERLSALLPVVAEET